MSATVTAGARPGLRHRHLTAAPGLAPIAAAAVPAGAYVIISPPTADLAAQLYRAHLFAVEGFSVWDGSWYSGHHVPGYSVLFPALASLLSPQLVAALAAVGGAVMFERLARRHAGRHAQAAAVLFAIALAGQLYSGRLTFVVGCLPALGAIEALDRGATPAACALATLSALCSPVAALLCAIAAAAHAAAGAWERCEAASAVAGLAVAAGALAPIAALAIAFPEGGREPFGSSSLLVALAVTGAVAALPRAAPAIRAGALIYAAVAVAAYLLPTPVGANVTRLPALLAAPAAVMALGGRRDRARLAGVIVVAAGLYAALQAPVADVAAGASDPSSAPAYYAPLLGFLDRRGGPPFRVEIPFTRSHWEAYVVAQRFPLARGWERQLDVADNPLFYGGRLTAAAYRAWLEENAVAYVAVPDAPADASALAERALIARGLPYLAPVMRSPHWRVYAVRHPTPIAQGAAALTALGPDWLTLRSRRPGVTVVHVRFTPYWTLAQGAGCVARAGRDIRLTLRRAGPVRLVARFSWARIGATTPRCT